MARVWQRAHKLIGPARILVASFAGLILIGTLLLLHPRASAAAPLDFVNALFTATSATCVTGLIVMDTGTSLTHFGQLVVLP